MCTASVAQLADLYPLVVIEEGSRGRSDLLRFAAEGGNSGISSRHFSIWLARRRTSPALGNLLPNRDTLAAFEARLAKSRTAPTDLE
jgi:hypothetical protein